MNRLTLFIPLIVFTVLAGFFWRGLSLDPAAMPSALIDKSFPVFILPSLESVNQNDMLEIDRSILLGEVSLVNVWATWCAACKYEHPVLNTLAEQGVSIVGINYKDNAPAAQKWLNELGNPYRANIFDQHGKLGVDLGVFGAPETYLVDKEGIIRHKHIGIVSMQVWNDTLKPLYEKYLHHR